MSKPTYILQLIWLVYRFNNKISSLSD